MSDPTTLPAFPEVRDYLHAADAESGAAEAHGLLCGMLCARAGIEPEPWLEQVLGPSHGPGAYPDVLDQVYRGTRTQFAGGELGFQPLLPDDEEPLPVRIHALGQWCGGFLAGLGLTETSDSAALEGEVGEFVRDVAEITRIRFEPAAGEEDESAYMEIVEYLRMGVLLTYETLNSPPGEPADTVH